MEQNFKPMRRARYLEPQIDDDYQDDPRLHHHIESERLHLHKNSDNHIYVGFMK